jgi:hypothetical protein
MNTVSIGLGDTEPHNLVSRVTSLECMHRLANTKLETYIREKHA